MQYSTEQLGNALADAALSEWGRPVLDIDPGQDDDREHIARYFNEVRNAGGTSWAWFLKERHPKGLAEYIEVTLDGEHEEWCGLFVAYCAQRLIGGDLEANKCVPLTIIPGIAYYVLPGTPRIADPAKWAQAGAPLPDRPAPAKAKRGDIFTVGKGANGSHIGIIDEPPNAAGEFTTIEGNARGRLGNGTEGEGVIRRVRNVRDIKQLIRFTADHYITA